MQAAFGERGRLFLHQLPSLLTQAVERWDLTGLSASPKLSYNFVAFARRNDIPVVLKIGVPDPEIQSEIAALKLFDGRGAVRLLECSAEEGMLLLEQAQPGNMLVSVTDDQRATHIAAETMRLLWRTGMNDPHLFPLERWMRGLERHRHRHSGGTGALDPILFRRAEEARDEILAGPSMAALIHGDLHHFNILSSDRGWLAIDPKGVVGPAAYEVGPFLLNPWVEMNPDVDLQQVTAARVDIFSEVLGIERRALLQCSLAHAVLSSVWSIEDGSEWRTAMRCAEVLSAMFQE